MQIQHILILVCVHLYIETRMKYMYCEYLRIQVMHEHLM